MRCFSRCYITRNCVDIKIPVSTSLVVFITFYLYVVVLQTWPFVWSTYMSKRVYAPRLCVRPSIRPFMYMVFHYTVRKLAARLHIFHIHIFKFPYENILLPLIIHIDVHWVWRRLLIYSSIGIIFHSYVKIVYIFVDSFVPFQLLSVFSFVYRVISSALNFFIHPLLRSSVYTSVRIYTSLSICSWTCPRPAVRNLTKNYSAINTYTFLLARGRSNILTRDEQLYQLQTVANIDFKFVGNRDIICKFKATITFMFRSTRHRLRKIVYNFYTLT